MRALATQSCWFLLKYSQLQSLTYIIYCKKNTVRTRALVCSWCCVRPCARWAGGKDSFVPNMRPGHKQVGKGSSMIRDSTDKNPGDLRPSSHRHREPLQGGIASYHIYILLWQHNHTRWRPSCQDHLSGGSLQTSQMSRWHCAEGRYAPLILGHCRFAW